LPRFNMPLELGIFLGAKHFGSGRQSDKSCLILDKEPHRFLAFISDIRGQDPRSHDNDPEKLVGQIRKWLRNASDSDAIPGGGAIWDRYQEFLKALPKICKPLEVKPLELEFKEKRDIIHEWLEARKKQK